jgi:hypothetical protein
MTPVGVLLIAVVFLLLPFQAVVRNDWILALPGVVVELAADAAGQFDVLAPVAQSVAADAGFSVGAVVSRGSVATDAAAGGVVVAVLGLGCGIFAGHVVADEVSAGHGRERINEKRTADLRCAFT